jgi:hypothetical protein
MASSSKNFVRNMEKKYRLYPFRCGNTTDLVEFVEVIYLVDEFNTYILFSGFCTSSLP